MFISARTGRGYLLTVGLQPGINQRFLNRWLLSIRLILSLSLLSLVLVILRLSSIIINIPSLSSFSLIIDFKFFNCTWTILCLIGLSFLLGFLSHSQILCCNFIFLTSLIPVIILLINKLNLLLLHNLVSLPFLSIDKNITHLSSMVKVDHVVFNESLDGFSHVVDLRELNE